MAISCFSLGKGWKRWKGGQGGKVGQAKDREREREEGMPQQSRILMHSAVHTCAPATFLVVANAPCCMLIARQTAYVVHVLRTRFTFTTARRLGMLVGGRWLLLITWVFHYGGDTRYAPALPPGLPGAQGRSGRTLGELGLLRANDWPVVQQNLIVGFFPFPFPQRPLIPLSPPYPGHSMTRTSKRCSSREHST